MDKIISLDHGKGCYDITILEKTQLCQKLDPFIKKKGRVFVVSDSNLEKHYLPELLEALKTHSCDAIALIIPAGEKSKSFAPFETLLNEMVEAGIDRNSLIIAFGGGVVGDVAGFAAASILRGVDYIHIPTSLLSQIDSSIGGKTGINLDTGKNLVGAFHQPLAVLIVPEFLEKLPLREKRAGYAEIVKHGLICDGEFFQWLESCHGDMLNFSTPTQKKQLHRAIARSCQIKVDIVTKDVEESGARALLNLGHSFGHAIETYLGYDGNILHGEAVAIGSVMAFLLAENLLHCPSSDTQRVIAHYRQCGLPVDFSDISRLQKWRLEEMVELISYDKKNRNGKITLILPKKIGKAKICEGLEKNMLISAFEPIFDIMMDVI